MSAPPTPEPQAKRAAMVARVQQLKDAAAASAAAAAEAARHAAAAQTLGQEISDAYLELDVDAEDRRQPEPQISAEPSASSPTHAPDFSSAGLPGLQRWNIGAAVSGSLFRSGPAPSEATTSPAPHQRPADDAVQDHQGSSSTVALDAEPQKARRCVCISGPGSRLHVSGLSQTP